MNIILIIGDISSEYCESEKKARFIASRLCIDKDIIVVYDKDQNKLFMKSMSKCGIPEAHKQRLSLVADRPVDWTDNIGKKLYCTFIIIISTPPHIIDIIIVIICTDDHLKY